MRDDTSAASKRPARSKLLFSVGLIAIGLSLLSIGAILALGGSDAAVPDWAQSQTRVPAINIYGGSPLAPLAVHADFTNADDYTITIFSTTSDQTSFRPVRLPAGTSQSVSVVVGGLEAFDWSVGDGLREVTLDNVSDFVFTSQPNASSTGRAREAVFLGEIHSGGPPLVLHLKVEEDPLSRSGPFRRIALPEVGSQPVEQPPTTPTGDLDLEYSDQVVRAQTIGRIDGIEYTVAKLHIRATGSPYEATSPDWVLHRSVPSPVSGPPTIWEVQQHFWVDLVYRDLEWDRSQQRKLFFAGVLVGLGTALVTIPLGMRGPD
jgi:hypothetical protein